LRLGIRDSPHSDESILLFSGLAPVAAVPSAFVDVPVRLFRGEPGKNYAADYEAAREIQGSGLPQTFEARQRAYLLLKKHGQETCKRSKHRCEVCPLTERAAPIFEQKRGTPILNNYWPLRASELTEARRYTETSARIHRPKTAQSDIGAGRRQTPEDPGSKSEPGAPARAGWRTKVAATKAGRMASSLGGDTEKGTGAEG
jgi:hypothetical protein